MQQNISHVWLLHLTTGMSLADAAVCSVSVQGAQQSLHLH